jgi:hypothetical protein
VVEGLRAAAQAALLAALAHDLGGEGRRPGRLPRRRFIGRGRGYDRERARFVGEAASGDAQAPPNAARA